MPRKPRSEVAATKTITLRVTPDDKARYERQIAARAADLPERTMAALLRRLVQDSEEGLTLRLPAHVRALLDALVRDRDEELRRLNVHEAQATPVGVIVGLILDAAKARGLTAPSTSSEKPHAESAPTARTEGADEHAEQASGKATRKRSQPTDGAKVHAALVAAIGRGATQADFAKRAGIDKSHLSRFVKSKKGLSPEILSKLSSVLESST